MKRSNLNLTARLKSQSEAHPRREGGPYQEQDGRDCNDHGLQKNVTRSSEIDQ